MNAAFYASLPRYTVPALRGGYAVWYVTRANRLRCDWVVDPISRKPVAVWTAENDYFISFR